MPWNFASQTGNSSHLFFALILIVVGILTIWLLENLHKLNKGVKHASVNFINKKYTVSFNANEITLRQLVELLVSIHYIPEISLQSMEKKDEKKASMPVVKTEKPKDFGKYSNKKKGKKKKDQNLTVGVSYLSLIKTHEDLSDFDSNLKVKPILRSLKDKKSLYKSLTDGTVDYISSNHVPLEIEKKHLEYPYASHGAIGLETAFAALNTYVTTSIELETLIEKLTSGPRSVLNIEIKTPE